MSRKPRAQCIIPTTNIYISQNESDRQMAVAFLFLFIKIGQNKYGIYLKKGEAVLFTADHALAHELSDLA